MTDLVTALDRDGFAVLPAVFSPAQVADLLRALGAALATNAEAVRSQEGSVYAARNVLDLWPGAADAWRVPGLAGPLTAVLGPAFGLVRVLFFDKPPERTWALPWHKDLTIAVRDHTVRSPRFGKPTKKAGVPHVEAPEEVLAAMVTARIHLDEVTEANGPLKVLPGSHRTGKELVLDGVAPVSVLAAAGDVLLMRPLLTHCSNKSHPGTDRHRRILHCEFAATAQLPDGFGWYAFHPAQSAAHSSRICR